MGIMENGKYHIMLGLYWGSVRVIRHFEVIGLIRLTRLIAF